MKDFLKQYKPGHSMPAAFYHDNDVFLQDLKLLANSWFYVASSAEVATAGSYLVRNIGEDSIIIIRGKDDVVRVFYNSCCHRGSRIYNEGESCGKVSKIVCPYHQWSYDYEGKLVYAGNMGKDFDITKYNLQNIVVEDVSGLLFIWMGDNPNYAEIKAARDKITPYIKDYDVSNLKVAAQSKLVEDCNWKLTLENNRECYHCDSNHPELTVALHPFGFGAGFNQNEQQQEGLDEFYNLMNKKRKQWQELGLAYEISEFELDNIFRIVRLPLVGGTYSHTVDGNLACKKLLAPFKEPESSGLSVWTHLNSWHHFLCDHVVTFSVLPIAANKTLVTTAWLVRADAKEGVDYDVDNLTKVWNQTNAQDKKLAERNHIGSRSRGYRPGPYSKESETMVDYFSRRYMDDVARQNGLSIGKVFSGGEIECVDISHETHNVKTFKFVAANGSTFAFKAGQYITFRASIDNNLISRSYTISSSPNDKKTIEVTIKLQQEGVFSSWIHKNLQVGEHMKALPVSGEFSYEFLARRDKKILLSAGSGITPMMSMLRDLSIKAIESNIVFISFAREKQDYIFANELADLQKNMPNVKVIWVPEQGDFPSGFINAEVLSKLIPDLISREVYCCGPEIFMQQAVKNLTNLNFDLDFYHQESFDFAKLNNLNVDKKLTPINNVELSIQFGGKKIIWDGQSTILESAKQHNVVLPFACSNGICGTCLTKKITGEVEMNHNGGIMPEEIEQGYILPCCSIPTTDLILEIK